MPDVIGSSTPAVVVPSSIESSSSQTDESIITPQQTSMDDSASSSTPSTFDEVSTSIHSEVPSSDSDLQVTSKAGEQCIQCIRYNP